MLPLMVAAVVGMGKITETGQPLTALRSTFVFSSASELVKVPNRSLNWITVSTMRDDLSRPALVIGSM